MFFKGFENIGKFSQIATSKAQQTANFATKMPKKIDEIIIII